MIIEQIRILLGQTEYRSLPNVFCLFQIKMEVKMDNLIKMVSEKAGITEAQARSAVNTVSSFLKNKMPPGLSSQVETFLNVGPAAKVVANITEHVAGVLGK